MAPQPRTTVVVTALAVLAVLGTLWVMLLLHGDPDGTGEPGGDDTHEGVRSPGLGAQDAGGVRPPPGLAAPPPAPSSRESRLFLRVVRWPDGAIVTGAAVQVTADGETLIGRGRPSISGHLDVPVPEGVQSVRIVATAPEYSSTEVSLDAAAGLTGLVLLELRPTDGWLGRVVTSYGDPVVGAQVVARRYWPPRPAYLESQDGVVSITSVQAVAPASTGGLTNTTGHYYVEPFDDQNVVDLVLSVVNEAVASERMHVPLPHAEQELPDLVAFGAAPLTGRVVDQRGYPVPRVEVQVDRGPGLDRYVEESVFTDAEGRFSVGRVFSAQHLRVEDDRSWFMGGRTQALELPMRDGWVRVEPGAPWVSLVLDAGGAVAGSILDAASSQPVRDGLVLLMDERGAELAAVLADSDGRFEVLVPPGRIGERVTLQLSAPGYDAWSRSTIIEPRDTAHALPEFLSPGVGTHLVKGQVRVPEFDTTMQPTAQGVPNELLGEPAQGVVVRAYLATLGGPVGEWVITDELPEEFELFWEGVTGTKGEFAFLATGLPDDRLVVVSEMAVPDGALHLGHWGPQTLSVAKRGIRLLQSHGQSIRVDVNGLDADHRYLVQQTSWNPWTLSSWSGSAPFPVRSEGQSSLWLESATRGAAFFDVRVDRGPVSAPVASSTEWMDLADLQPPMLEIPEFRTVTGQIAWYAPADWPDLCLAFVGPPVPEWRSEWLGESDWCVRPREDGRFRLPGIPPGDYTLMLYRPVGVEGVEVLAERSVSVNDDLFQVPVWPQRPDSEAAAYILER